MQIRGTTIIALKHKDKVVVAGDGQVTFDQTIIKHGARKVRRLYHNRVIVGFAGATADAFTLFDRFDQKLGLRPRVERMRRELEWQSPEFPTPHDTRNRFARETPRRSLFQARRHLGRERKPGVCDRLFLGEPAGMGCKEARIKPRRRQRRLPELLRELTHRFADG